MGSGSQDKRELPDTSTLHFRFLLNKNLLHLLKLMIAGHRSQIRYSQMGLLLNTTRLSLPRILQFQNTHLIQDLYYSKYLLDLPFNLNLTTWVGRSFGKSIFRAFHLHQLPPYTSSLISLFIFLLIEHSTSCSPVSLHPIIFLASIILITIEFP